MRTIELGPLRVHLTGGADREGGGQGPAVVLFHGFGAPGDDLVSLWRVLAAPPGTRFVFPEAPLSLAQLGYAEGRAWWMLDPERLAALQRGRTPDVAALRREVPAGLAEARRAVVTMLDELAAELRPSTIVLGGFSQGAMLACDVALRSDRALAGLVLMSGTLICEDEWAPLFAKRAALPSFQSHGDEDPLLPYANAVALRDHMKGASWDVTWVPFRGGHEIPHEVVRGAGDFLTRHVPAA